MITTVGPGISPDHPSYFRRVGEPDITQTPYILLEGEAKLTQSPDFDQTE